MQAAITIKHLLLTLSVTWNLTAVFFCFHPSQYLITNVQDACILPYLYKRITKDQGFFLGRQKLSGEDLWKQVLFTWNKLPNQVIAWYFIYHHQLVCDITKHHGNNDFLYEKDIIHFGVTKFFVDKEYGQEVMASKHPTMNPKTNLPFLKHKPPDVSELRLENLLSIQELCFLQKNMGPPERYTDVEKMWKR